MNPIKISIIVPSYNQSIYLEETLNSIVNQGYANLELIIIDGGSTDGSFNVIKKFEEHISYWVSEKDNGQSEAINKGLKKASGDIISWLNSDDYYAEGTLNKVANLFEDKNVNAICGDCYFFYEGEPGKNYLNRHGSITFDRTIEYWKTNPPAIPPQPSIFLRKRVWDKIGYLNESLRFGMDYELWLRVLNEFDIIYVPILFSYYRFHPSSKSYAENGFEKFHQEWHKIFMHELRKKGFFTRLNHNLEYSLYYFDWKYSKKRLLLKYLLTGAIKKSKY